jgi:glycerol-3-phosphate acyltransferase PlsY
MLPTWTATAAGVVSYLLGSIPFGLIIVRIRSGIDVRSVGSGNIGATNVLRVVGRGEAVLTLILDAAKGYLAVLLAGLLTDHALPVIGCAAMAAILGHIFPVYLRFRGGKGVATAFGVFLYLSTKPVLISLGVFLLVVLLWRYVSLASIVAAAAFPFSYFLLERSSSSSPWILFSACFCACLIVLKHHENIQRLLKGTERRLGETK